MYSEQQTHAISLISIMTFIFLLCFSFNLTNKPQQFLYLALASFGYILVLLSDGLKQKTRKIVYLILGYLFIILSCVTPLSFIL